MCKKETYHGDLFLNLNDEVKKTSKCKEIKEWRLRQQQYLLLQLTKIVHKWITLLQFLENVLAKAVDWDGYETEHIKVLETLKERTASKKKQANCLCKHCDSVFVAIIANVVSKGTTNCGCIRYNTLTKHNLHSSRIYRCWSDMKNRCDTNKAGYENITYCDSWRSFENFYQDMLETYSEKLTLDRIDNSGNYCKENCRWADASTQMSNRRKPKRSTTSKYRNVSKCSINRYAARVTYNYVTHTIGYYENEVDAAKAVDEYVIENKLPQQLNFNQGD